MVLVRVFKYRKPFVKGIVLLAPRIRNYQPKPPVDYQEVDKNKNGYGNCHATFPCPTLCKHMQSLEHQEKHVSACVYSINVYIYINKYIRMQSVRLIPERIELVSHGFLFTLQRLSLFWLTLGPPIDVARLATKGYRNLLFPWGLKDKREVPWRLGFS